MAARPEWMKREKSGWKTPQIYMIPLTRRMKTDKTAMTTFQLVVLSLSCQMCGLRPAFGRENGHVQLSPRQGCLDGPVVGVGVDELIGVAIPSVIETLLPEARAIQVWLSDAEQSERGDGEGEFEGYQAQEHPRSFPFPGHGGEAGAESHVRLLMNALV